MCGIIGYIGSGNACEIIVNGLKRLEYRGYDSAGIALVGSDMYTRKRLGKLKSLEAALDYNETSMFRLGIGHTRWATHGAPSELNAHPHYDCSGDIALVHNGIIENHAVLREALLKEGHTFVSDTDTEVVVHLIEHYHRTEPFIDAIFRALSRLEGAYGIAVVSRREPDRLIAARKGSPLILGVGDGEMILASDASAIVDCTRNVVYMDDNELMEIRADGYRSYDLEMNRIEKKVEAIDWDIASIEKRGFDHFMLKEIFEQPETIRDSYRGRIIPDSGNVRLDGLRLTDQELLDIRRIIFIACGTSWHAGLIGEYLIEEYARIPVEVEYASEFRYRKPVLQEGDLVITISQSGETADTLAAMREARARGIRVLGITNVVGSTIARESDGGVYTHAGPEIGVASTKAFTSQVTILILLTILLARRRDMTAEEGAEIIRDLKKVSDHLGNILENDEIVKIAGKYSEKSNFLYLGRGINYPVALEGALKLKEISYIHAEGYPAAEMKHGPIALIDENMPVVFIAPQNGVHSKILSNMEEVKARMGNIIAIATEGDTDISRYADHVIYIPDVHSMITPLISVVPLQLLAYHIAVMRGCDVDQPRNLAKSVTVE